MGRRQICLLPEPAPLVGGWFFDDDEIGEGEVGAILALLADDHGPKALQRANLPVDVQHLRLQEGGRYWAATGAWRRGGVSKAILSG